MNTQIQRTLKKKKVGVLMDKDDGKKSVKIDLVPASGWDGWLVVAERRPKETNSDACGFTRTRHSFTNARVSASSSPFMMPSSHHR